MYQIDDPMPSAISEVVKNTYEFRYKAQSYLDELDKASIGLEKMKISTKFFNFIYTNFQIIDIVPDIIFKFNKSVIIKLEDLYEKIFKENTYEKTFGIHYQLFFLSSYRLYKKFYESPRYNQFIKHWDGFQEEYDDVIFESLVI